MFSSEHCFLGKADKVVKAAEKGTEEEEKIQGCPQSKPHL